MPFLCVYNIIVSERFSYHDNYVRSRSKQKRQKQRPYPTSHGLEGLSSSCIPSLFRISSYCYMYLQRNMAVTRQRFTHPLSYVWNMWGCLQDTYSALQLSSSANSSSSSSHRPSLALPKSTLVLCYLPLSIHQLQI